ncbi:MAG TPA: metallophosphoesterase family protein [Rhizomicrobium sp.]|nr:metallophosphoesterase family protein [Rhizomicrobium sp.]
MKLLALSDAHANIIAVRKLRAQERNEFDAIVIAGDLGGDSAAELFNVLNTFRCPIIYVYGNHDDSLKYNKKMKGQNTLLHMNIIKCNEFAFAGYSGCQANWGQNPIALNILGGTPTSLEFVTGNLEAEFLAYRRKKADIEHAYDRAIGRLKGVTRKKQKLKLIEQRDAEIAKAHKPMEVILEGRKYRTLRSDFEKIQKLKHEVLRANREKLLETIHQSGVSPSNLIVVTHERTPWKYLGGAFLHLFGHRHGFADHVYKGARCINVSALDGLITVRPRRLRSWSYSDCRNVNGGNYVVIEISSSREISVVCRRLRESYEEWIPLKKELVYGLPCVPQEEIYLN